MTEFCCDWLRTEATRECPDHPDRTECAGTVIHRYPDGWGIPIHDGGTSYVTVRFCPSCGAPLDGPPAEPARARWAPSIGDEVWYNYPDGSRVGRVVARVVAGLRAGQPVIEVLDDEAGPFARRKRGDRIVVAPEFLLPFRYGGPEWKRAMAEGRVG